ncbi:MAG: hypothetical protein HYZ95_03445 [Candidatus Omnitrophica bacterium]|nr:hypothetical protein [Candidatus Omnitrophota bacterium]
MRKVLALGLMLLAAGPAWAASGDAAGTYTVTVTKIEVSQDNGSTYFTVFSGSQAINIAASNAGAVAAGLVNASGVPPGTYNLIRTTLGESLLIKGFVNNGATTFYTNNDADGFALNAGAADTPGGDYATSTLTIPAANRASTLTVSFTATGGGAASKVKVSFDTGGVLSVVGGAPSLNAPSVTVTSS